MSYICSLFIMMFLKWMTEYKTVISVVLKNWRHKSSCTLGIECEEICSARLSSLQCLNTFEVLLSQRHLPSRVFQKIAHSSTTPCHMSGTPSHKSVEVINSPWNSLTWFVTPEVLGQAIYIIVLHICWNKKIHCENFWSFIGPSTWQSCTEPSNIKRKRWVRLMVSPLLTH